MLNETLFLATFDDLKELFLHELTILHVALIYVVMYVIYKTMGRYVYFKPDEHSSKINRTFLAISVAIVTIHALGPLFVGVPFLPEFRWFFVLFALVFLIAPLSIMMDWIIWNYDRYGRKGSRGWHYNYLPVPNDYYKTSVSKSEQSGNTIHSWEEEGVETTRENIHSDALLSVAALVIFLYLCGEWTYASSLEYGYKAYFFAVPAAVVITAIYIDRSVFAWISYIEEKYWWKD
jgi:hypothetical protein